ncbi:MAG TPA: penicillin-insensitive murein endopeptidase [Labilithrix sp.]|jgi:penicillin-insensitive murein endopeptidase|nr:penicillin-insensitive murein endopeptidase [Labilithrix sp.]
MRAPSSFRVLAFGFALAAVGCVGASRPSPSGPRSPAARQAARGEGGELSSGTLAPGATSTDCDDARPGPADDDDDSEHTTIDDGFEGPPPAAPGGAETALPFAELTDAEIASRLRADIGALGPMSIGRAHGGVLVAGVRMSEGSNWEVVHPGLAWGTKETVDGLARAIDAVAARFPNTPKAFVGDISAKQGGHLHPHVSHQSGRDVDLGYYLTEGHRWYATATGSNLDRARTWHLVRTLIAESDIDLILVDLQIQRILKAYALEIGEDPAWLDQIFQVGGKSQRPLIFHAKGHATHLHVRFYSPMAQELGRRAYRVLLARRLVSPPTIYITHTVKPGETLSHLALRYKVTGDAIKKANALTKDTLRLNKPYKIPQTGGIAMPGRVAMPPRRVPPTPKALVAGAGWGGEPCRRASLR